MCSYISLKSVKIKWWVMVWQCIFDEFFAPSEGASPPELVGEKQLTSNINIKLDNSTRRKKRNQTSLQELAAVKIHQRHINQNHCQDDGTQIQRELKIQLKRGAMILSLKSMAEGFHQTRYQQTSHTLAMNEGMDFWLLCICVFASVWEFDEKPCLCAMRSAQLFFYRAETRSDLSVSGLYTPNPQRDRTQRETALLKLKPSRTGKTSMDL